MRNGCEPRTLGEGRGVLHRPSKILPVVRAREFISGGVVERWRKPEHFPGDEGVGRGGTWLVWWFVGVPGDGWGVMNRVSIRLAAPPGPSRRGGTRPGISRVYWEGPLTGGS